jgi:uncharacterized tellurite resistance protein B-like protein
MVDESGEEGFDQDHAQERQATRTRLEAAALELQEKRKIADSLRTEDLDLAARVKALGFDGDTAGVFDLLPVIHVAWADGKVQRKEREAIMDVLAVRGVTRGSPAHTMMEAMLEERPSQIYLDESLAVFRALVAGNKRRIEVMVDLCVAIAEASGGFLGLGNPVDESEREMLDRIAESLGERAKLWLRAKMGETAN